MMMEAKTLMNSFGNNPFVDADLMMEELEILKPALTLGETTETYNPYQNAKPLECYFYTADFMSSGSTSRLNIYYGLPVHLLKASEADTLSTVNYEYALYLYDQEWNIADSVCTKRSYLLNPQPDQISKGSLLIDKQALNILPGLYHYIVRVKDLNSELIGMYRDTIAVTPYEHGKFNVSQILLATNIRKLQKGQEPGKYTRGEFNIMPLPSRTFRKKQQIIVYCEVYYLNQSSEEKKSYNIDFTIKADKLDKSLVSKIYSPFGKLLGKNEQDQSITLTFQKEQEDRNRVVQQKYISMDINDFQSGKYNLQIDVTDNTTGEKISRGAIFFVAKED